ncbi:hypothetical protein ACQW08_04385 [Gluconobacter japonicus]|uniref:hypothetical protein n=1 Tax=Gluconobacter japonicus TaxID=376620 RepID=UPI003D29CD76
MPVAGTPKEPAFRFLILVIEIVSLVVDLRCPPSIRTDPRHPSGAAPTAPYQSGPMKGEGQAANHHLSTSLRIAAPVGARLPFNHRQAGCGLTSPIRSVAVAGCL